MDRPCADRSRHSPHTRVEPGQPHDGAWCPGVADGIRTLLDHAGRIRAVLADLERVDRPAFHRTHDDDCWRWHTGCLAARVARTLRGETDG